MEFILNRIGNILVGASIIYLVVKQVTRLIRVKHNEKAEKRKKERETRRMFKLQEKRDNFNEFKNVIENYEKTCKDCYEFNYTQYLECHPNDFDGLERRKSRTDLTKPCKLIGEHDRPDQVQTYMENLDKPISNLRVTLQDFTVDEVIHMFSF